jgi:hypothetical protein
MSTEHKEKENKKDWEKLKWKDSKINGLTVCRFQ